MKEKGQVFWGKTFTLEQIYNIVVLAGNTQAKPLYRTSLNLCEWSIKLYQFVDWFCLSHLIDLLKMQ